MGNCFFSAFVVTCVLVQLIVQAGWREAGIPNYYFGEGRIGTLISLAYLLASGVICFAISAKLLKLKLEPRLWKGTFIGLMALLLFYLIAMTFYWFLGDMRHERHFYYFRHNRAAWWISWVVFILAAFCVIKLWRLMKGVPFAKFWLGFGILIYYTAADDFFKFHERNGRFITKQVLHLPKEHWLSHLNDWLVVSYGVIAIILFLKYRRPLFQLSWMLLSLGIAFLFFVAYLVLDMTHWAAWLEKTFKVGGGVFILIALLAAYWSSSLSRASELAQKK
ncbi:MAG: hypothetical protein R3F23_06540 [Verrucomicrobiia bacterium]